MHWIHSLSAELANLSGIVNAVSAFSTLAAVIVSLKLAAKSHQPKLVSLAYVGKILHADASGTYRKSTGKQNIAVSINNRGPVPVTLNVSSFNWRFWRHDLAMMMSPLSPDLRNSNLVIPPAEGRLVILTDRLEELRQGMLDQKLRFLRWRIRLEIHGTDGVIHHAKLSKDLCKILSRSSK